MLRAGTQPSWLFLVEGVEVLKGHRVEKCYIVADGQDVFNIYTTYAAAAADAALLRVGGIAGFSAEPGAKVVEAWQCIDSRTGHRYRGTDDYYDTEEEADEAADMADIVAEYRRDLFGR